MNQSMIAKAPAELKSEASRTYNRRATSAAVSFRTKDGRAASGIAADLSIGGAMFVATETLAVGDHGVIQLADGKGPIIDLEAEVIWTKPAGATHSSYGVRFTSLTETQRYALLDLLYAGAPETAPNVHPLAGSSSRPGTDAGLPPAFRAYYVRLLRRIEHVHALAPGTTDRVLFACVVDGKPLQEALADAQVCDADAYERFMGAIYDVPFIDLRRDRPNPLVSDAIPSTLATSQNVIAVDRVEDHLVVAMADPMDLPLLDLMQMRVHERIVVKFALIEDVQRAVSEVYQEAQLQVAAPTDSSAGGADDPDVEDLEALRKLSDATPVVSLVESLLRTAVEDGASDIHMEPWADKTLVRLRLDGVLHKIRTLPKAIYPAVVSRVKIMSRMDITVRQVPQDGRASMRYAHKDFDLRVSSVPTHHGEKIVIRLLEKNPTFKTLSAVGLNDANYKLMAPLIHRPHGMILCCGPTGSGKSTTLFSVLQEINDGTTNITTIEDPIEYSVDGVNQIEVNVKRGLTFGSALRALLRQDPDVIYVGEIRDAETAELAVRAALTGHLLLSTLHTNTAVQAIARLADIGVDTALIGASLIAVMSQRLLRVLCERCKEPHVLDPDERTLLEQMLPPGAELPMLFRGRGCANCHQTGYRGRMPVHEVIVVDEPLRRLVAKGADSTQLNDYVKNLPSYSDLRSDAVRRMLAGRTTLQEVVEMTV